MTPDLHRRLIAISLGLYFVATWCSMAGMEIFGWLTFLLTTIYAVRRVRGAISFRDLSPYLPWKSCLLLLVITILGVAINAVKPEVVYDIGAQRWMILLATSSLAIALCPPGFKGYRFFLFFISVTAVYAVFQSVTGIDLIRPGSHRAVPSLNGTTAPWRSAGWSGSPLQYGYIAGMHVCLPLAMVLLTYKQKRTWIFWCSLAAVVLVGASIITTFTRGAWIAMACAWFVMALIAAPRVAALLTIAGITLTGAAATLSETFRLRLFSLIDPTYTSNSERWFLWKANWEMFKDYPILGLGYSENENRAGEYVTRMGKPDAFKGHAHNNYLQFLSGTGITGLITYLFIISFMLYITYRLWRSLPKDAIWPRAIALGALGAQIHLHVGGFTECNFKAGATNHNVMMVWALVIAMSALNAKRKLPSFNELSAVPN
jgi:O-antigen ligase